MGAIPGTQYDPETLHMDSLEEGRTVWISIGLTVAPIIVLIHMVVVCNTTVLVSRLEGVYIPVIGHHPGILHS